MAADGAVFTGDLKTLAIVSGKGGSGKTLFATTLALALDDAGLKVVMVDADVGTGGLSYYLSLHHVRSIQFGFSELISSSRKERSDSPSESEGPSETRVKLDLKSVERSLQPVSGTRQVQLLPVGDHTEIAGPGPKNYEARIENIIRTLSDQDCDIVIIDCRGGIDGDSLAVCRSVDGILLVAETDAASIRASEHLTRVIAKFVETQRSGSRRRPSDSAHGKLIGFVINKAFADPTQVATSSTGFFRTRYLGPIPFDFETTRRFIFGQLPLNDSVFFVHVQAAATKLFPSLSFPHRGLVWSQHDYDRLSLRDINSVVGGFVCAGLVLIVLYVSLVHYFLPGQDFEFSHTIAGSLGLRIFGAVAGIAGSIEALRKQVGRAARAVFDLTKRTFRFVFRM